MGLWILGHHLWAIITYAIFTILTVKTRQTTLGQGFNGGWLVAVVAAQSVPTWELSWPFSLAPRESWLSSWP